jgi:hypothetical protein
MEHCFQVQHLDIEKLLTEWRWLCPEEVRLLARNVFGDLFLITESGQVFRLDVSVGRLESVADSEEQFLELAGVPDNRHAWLAEKEEEAFAAKGLVAGADQCIGFDIPLVFAADRRASKPYILDIYENLSFLGDLHKQIAEVPDGSKIKLRIKRTTS